MSIPFLAFEALILFANSLNRLDTITQVPCSFSRRPFEDYFGKNVGSSPHMSMQIEEAKRKITIKD
jgi:hypothetical protein